MSAQTIARTTSGIIARAVLKRVRDRAFGVLVRDVPEYEPDALVTELGQSAAAIRLAMPGLSDKQAQQIQSTAAQAGFPADRFVTTVEAAERWRNDPAVKETIVVIAPREIPKLNSLNRFETVSGADLFQLVCREGKEKLSPNEAQKKLWDKVFPSKALASLIPLEGLLGYYTELTKCGEAELAVRSRELLYYLGLLPDPELFRSLTAARIRQRLVDNNRAVDQLRILSRTDRKRISNVLATNCPDEEAAELQAIYKKIMPFYREQNPELLSDLKLSDVQKLLRSSASARNNGGGNGEDNGGGCEDERTDTNPSVRAIDLLIEGKQKELTELGKVVRAVLNDDSQEDDKPEPIDPNSYERLDIRQSHPFQNLITRYVGPDHWGGMIVSTGRTLDEALALLDKTDFRAFDPNGPEWKLRLILRAEVDWIGGDNDLVAAYDEMCEHRRVLAEHVRALLSEPLLVLNASPELLERAEAYLDGYRRFVEGLKRCYEAIAKAAPEGIVRLCSQVIALDTIVFRTAGGFKAVLSPLHPLHLWKYVELSRQIRAQADTITEHERTLLRSRANDLPNFVTTLDLSDYITESGSRVLPEAGQRGGLPFYEELAHQYAGRDGLPELIRIAEKFCVLHPHARLGLRIAFIDPPEVDFLLKELVRFADHQGDDLTALHVRIFFTEHGHPRVAALGGGAEDEEGAERFRGAGSSDRFTLEVVETAMPVVRIAEELKQHPAHIAAYFDPSTAKAYRFPRTPSLTVHPLCLPMQFSFDRITKAVRVVPAADGGIFSVHNDLRNRLGNNVTGSFYGVTAELQTESSSLQQLAAGCTWLVIADRAQEGALAFDVPRVALHRCGKRDLAVYARALSLSRFVTEIDGQLRRCNYTPTKVAVERLITDLNLLLGDGLLSLVASANAGAAVDERRTRGLLGTLVASQWFQREHPRSLVVSVDSPEARRWLELRESGTRADLFGIVDESDGGFTVDLIEVKTYEQPEDAFRLSDTDISGPAIDQLLQTAGVIREIFTPDREEQRVVSPQRREILRQHLFRECFFEARSDEDKQHWSTRLNELFALEARVRIRLTLVVVGLTQVHDARQRTFAAQGQPVRLIELAEDEVRTYVGEPVPTRPSGNRPPRRLGHADGDNGSGGRSGSGSGAHVEAAKDKWRRSSDGPAPSVPESSEPLDSEERELIVRQAAELRRILRDHGVQVQELDADKAQLGPSVIRYRVRLRSGAKVSALRSRAEDIGRELASRTTPFIDNIVGENYVGIDLERPKRRTLALATAVEALPEVTGLQLPVAVGIAPDGSQVSVDLVQLPHLLVAGSTLSGKTVFLHAVLLSLIAKLPPERLELMIVDPKATDFVLYNGLPYLRSGQVITEAEDAIDHLRRLTDEEMRERTATLQRARLPNISEYNIAHPNAPLRPIVVVIDEYADLIAVLSKKDRAEFEREINRLAQRARSVGIHLVLATQRPTADIVTGQLKANMPCRVSFRLPQRVDSQTILDQSGAENLFGRGDMLLMLNDRLMRLQGYYMSPQEMTRFLGEHSEYVPVFEPEGTLKLDVNDNDRANHESLVGEVTGLAAGPDSGDLLDGDVMILEVEARPGRDTEVIGRAGEVLKQSVLAAWRHVQQHAAECGVDDSRIRDTGVSVHLVNIARYREGQSAGVSFVVAMVSALSGRAVRPRMAMTGEVSLKGHVGKVGGIPQKIVAAYRSGRTNIILPRANAADVARVPQPIRDAVQIHLVDNVAEAIAIALEAANHDPTANPSHD